jgi:transposase
LIPRFDGAICSLEWKEAFWDKYVTDVSRDPDLIAPFILKHTSKVERVIHESGILANWRTRELKKRGEPIICIDARLAHKALSGRINKSDHKIKRINELLPWNFRG